MTMKSEGKPSLMSTFTWQHFLTDCESTLWAQSKLLKFPNRDWTTTNILNEFTSTFTFNQKNRLFILQSVFSSSLLFRSKFLHGSTLSSTLIWKARTVVKVAFKRDLNNLDFLSIKFSISQSVIICSNVNFAPYIVRKTGFCL